MHEIPAFSFLLPTRIEFGFRSALRLPELLHELGYQKPMLVTDPGVMGSGILEPLLSVLQESGISFEIYDEIEANPKDREVDRGAEKARKRGCDSLIAAGGGSPMDCAKAMAVVTTHGDSVRAYAGPGKITGSVLPIVAIPTTSGTGSEVTFSSVITDTERHVKFTVKGPEIAPKVAFLDPELTRSMPPDLTAATGMDALTHAIEAFTVKRAEPLSDACALHAIDLIARHLKTAVKHGEDMEARSGMLAGSLLAGIAFSHSDVGSVHCLAEALGGIYDLPHGVCNAVMLPEVMAYNLDFCRERYARIATAMGVDWEDPGDGAEKAVKAVARMAREVGLPPFSSFGIDHGDIPGIASASAENGSNPSNPRPMTAEDYENLLRSLVAG